MRFLARACAAVVGLASITVMHLATAAETAPSAVELDRMAARFAPVDIRVDISSLPANERSALSKLIEASRYIDAIFMRQRSASNDALLLKLLGDTSPLGRARLDYFLLNKGPWSELDEDRSFLPGIPEKPQGGNFYPADATRDEVDQWMQALPEAERALATGFFTTIRRTPDGRLTPVPYSLEYQGELVEMARLLREAAALTQQPTLKAFLEKRARRSSRTTTTRATSRGWSSMRRSSRRSGRTRCTKTSGSISRLRSSRSSQ